MKCLRYLVSTPPPHFRPRLNAWSRMVLHRVRANFEETNGNANANAVKSMPATTARTTCRASRWSGKLGLLTVVAHVALGNPEGCRRGRSGNEHGESLLKVAVGVLSWSYP